MVEEVKFIEHDKEELRLQGNLPRCFFCGGDMLPVSDRERPTWRCENCHSVLRKGYLQEITNNIVKADLYNIEKAKRQGHGGGNKAGRKRKDGQKYSRKRETSFYPNSDAG